MPKYTVSWSKTYHASGSVEIEADSAQDAESIAQDDIGNYEGHMEYDGEKDFTEAYELKESQCVRACHAPKIDVLVK
jgi:hypothetical protein|tara:strand:- start:128 stop:358 length:231 start_codon:yes stop_codon:yes gene_type:complete